MDKGFNLKKGIIVPQAFLPRKICVLCIQSFSGPHAVCPTCISWLPALSFPCLKCATPLPHPEHRLCGQCIRHPPSVNQVFIGYAFVEPLRTLVHQFKYHQGLYLTSTLGHLILQQLTPLLPEIIIPVPLHSKRLRERGYNQALLLSKYLACKLNIPLDRHCCEKLIHTPSQAITSSTARRTNLQHAFKVSPISYQHVAIVDDVYTTGSTTLAIAAHLAAQGVRKIDIWCVARTVS